jgi:AGCS family alanine or glycine:cation symporter
MFDIAALIQRLCTLLWGPLNTPFGQVPGLLVFALFGAGIYLTIRLRGVQFRHLGRAARSVFSRGSEGAGGVLNPFQAFATAMAATIGTGNIAGVATAIVSGGPGALFWIWCYGLFATAIKFSEAVLGVTYRVGDVDRFAAGPSFYLRDGLKMPRLAALYALLAGIGVLTTTPLMQPNSIAVVLESKLRVPPLATGLGVSVLTWLVIIGGIQGIGRVLEKLAPLKVLLYLGGGLIVIGAHIGTLPDVLALIFREAFSFKSATGGGAGIGIMMAIRYGMARGVYANEAGYGTAAAASAPPSPLNQRNRDSTPPWRSSSFPS